MLLKRNTGKMVDERTRVIRDLLLRLSEVGIEPEAGFTATHLPGEGWIFEPDVGSVSSSSSSSRKRETFGAKVQPK